MVSRIVWREALIALVLHLPISYPMFTVGSHQPRPAEAVDQCGSQPNVFRPRSHRGCSLLPRLSDGQSVRALGTALRFEHLSSSDRRLVPLHDDISSDTGSGRERKDFPVSTWPTLNQGPKADLHSPMLLPLHLEMPNEQGPCRIITIRNS